MLKKISKTTNGLTETLAKSMLRRNRDSGSYDLQLREMALITIQTQTFEGSPILGLRGEEAEHAMDEMQKLFDDRKFWTSIPPQHRGADRWRIIPLIVKLSQESGIIPQSVNVQVKDVEIDPMGGGSFGDVYRGKLGKQMIVVKRLRPIMFVDAQRIQWPQLCRDISREALMWCNMSHPNIVPFLGIDASSSPNRDSMRLGMVLSYMEKGTVTNHLLGLGLAKQPDARTKIGWLQQVAQGMVYLHVTGPRIVHGDIKGPNIFIDAKGVLKIGDFGMSVFAGAEWSGKFGSNRGGTQRWQAPELLVLGGDDKAKRPTFKSDVYAFAMVCIEFFSEKFKPFDHITNSESWEMVESIVRGIRPQKPGSMPQDLFFHLSEWWNQSALQRPGIQDILAYLNQYDNPDWVPPTNHPQEPMMTSSFGSNDSDLLTCLLHLFPEEQALLTGVSQEGNKDYPVFILVDEASFIDGFCKACNLGTFNFSKFPFAALQFILERKKTVTAGFIFTTTSAYPVFTYGFRKYGAYKVVKITEPLIGDVTAVLQKIQELTLSSQHPGHLVLLSGGEQGWLDNPEFAGKMTSLLNMDWRIDIWAWMNNTNIPVQERWYNSHHPSTRFCYLNFLQHYFT